MRESVVHGQHGHSQSVSVECEVSRCSAVLLFLLKLLLFNSCCSCFTSAEMFDVAALKAADEALDSAAAEALDVAVGKALDAAAAIALNIVAAESLEAPAEAVKLLSPG